jgi:hypothetical protein
LRLPLGVICWATNIGQSPTNEMRVNNTANDSHPRFHFPTSLAIQLFP